MNLDDSIDKRLLRELRDEAFEKAKTGEATHILRTRTEALRRLGYRTDMPYRREGNESGTQEEKRPEY